MTVCKSVRREYKCDQRGQGEIASASVRHRTQARSDHSLGRMGSPMYNELLSRLNPAWTQPPLPSDIKGTREPGLWRDISSLLLPIAYLAPISILQPF